MTYFGFLVRFLLVPIVLLGLLLLWDTRQGRRLPDGLILRPAGWALLAHVALAVIWTTPWDNYLVATRVWWYDPQRVTGLTLGWVPVEEYLFFVLQTVMTGAWLLWLARRASLGGDSAGAPTRTVSLRAGFSAALGLIWAVSLVALAARWQPATYLALTLAWLVLPLLPQAALGAHVLWQQRRLIALALLVPVLYLSAADALAIRQGIWTISPVQTTGVLLAGILPLEEFIFFAATNMLIVFGMVLFVALPLPGAIRDRQGRAERPPAIHQIREN